MRVVAVPLTPQIQFEKKWKRGNFATFSLLFLLPLMTRAAHSSAGFCRNDPNEITGSFSPPSCKKGSFFVLFWRPLFSRPFREERKKLRNLFSFERFVRETRRGGGVGQPRRISFFSPCWPRRVSHGLSKKKRWGGGGAPFSTGEEGGETFF